MGSNNYSFDTTKAIRLLGVIGLLTVSFLMDAKVMSNDTDAEWDQLQTDKSCVLRRKSDKNGFHRELKTRIIINAETLDADEPVEILLQESFPSGIYIDLFETKSLEQFGGPQVYCEKDMDIEKPEYLSSEHEFYVYGELTRNGSVFYKETSLQVHLRYHRPNVNDDFDRVLLKPPELFMKIPEIRQSSASEGFRCNPTTDKMCHWQKLQCINTPTATDGILSFSVPVGRASDTGLVVSVTLVVTLAATFFLTKSIISKKQNIKQS